MESNRRKFIQAVSIGAAATLIPSGLARGQDRVIVSPKSGQSQALDALQNSNGKALRTYDNFEFVAGVVPQHARSGLEQDSRVAFVEDDKLAHATHHKETHGGGSGGSDDPCSGQPAQELPWGVDRIDAPNVSGNGTGVDVAILDTGIEESHCDLDVAGGYNFSGGSETDYSDGNGHGTHCAGIVGARDNDMGVLGVAPDVNLYAVKVLADDGSGSYSDIVAGIDWCISNNIEIMSLSLGGSSSSDTMDQAIETAHSDGHLIVVSAGNNDNNLDGSCAEENVSYPANHAKTVAVSAMDSDDTLASYSSVGSEVDIMAPGTNIRSTYLDSGYDSLSGTSMAAPHVSGVAALVWEALDSSGPGPNETVRTQLEDTAETVLGTCEEGNGLVDAPAAVPDTSDSSDDTASAPAIDVFSVTDTSNGPWTRAEISYEVSDADGDLSSVEMALLNGDTVVASATDSVSGSSASGGTELRTRDTADSVRLTVTDANGASTTESQPF